MKNSQKAIIRNLKKPGENLQSSALSILDDRGDIIGKLVPVDEKLANDSKVIDSLRKWRQKYMHFFLTQFTATNKRTSHWLNTVVLPNDDRILFIIYDDKGIAIGNFGVCNIDQTSAQLDNLIRGEVGGHKRLIFYAELCLIHWLFEIIEIKNIYLHVFSNNQKTLSLHKSVGFRKTKIYKLEKSTLDNEVKYMVNHEKIPADDELGYIRMEIEKSEFYTIHRDHKFNNE